MLTPDERKVFLRGQMIDTADGPMFLHGDVMVNNKNQVQFLPGQLVYNEERDKEEFIPGITGETASGDNLLRSKFSIRCFQELNSWRVGSLRKGRKLCLCREKLRCSLTGRQTGNTILHLSKQLAVTTRIPGSTRSTLPRLLCRKAPATRCWWTPAICR